jgi:hypothetical protein
VIEEIDHLDASSGGGGSAEAILLTFFRCTEALNASDITEKDILGYAF